jgi:hypothetical protein
MGIFNSLARSVAKSVGLDVDYRERYRNAHPQDPKCQMCGMQLYWDKNKTEEDSVTIDHIWPQKLAVKFPVLAKPLSSLANLQPLCKSCNSRKRDEMSSVNFQQSLAAILREIRRVLDDLNIRDQVRYDLERYMND